jgi:hypothetical protein
MLSKCISLTRPAPRCEEFSAARVPVYRKGFAFFDLDVPAGAKVK